MTAVFSIVHLPKEKQYDVYCYEHHEQLVSEPPAGEMRSAEWCDYLARQLCDPRPDDDPNTTRLMRRGKIPQGAMVLFEFFVVPVRTPFGIGFISDYWRGALCPSCVSAVAMQIYADVKRWTKLQNNNPKLPIGRAPKGERDRILRKYHDIIFAKGKPQYAPKEEAEEATQKAYAPSPDTDDILALVPPSFAADTPAPAAAVATDDSDSLPPIADQLLEQLLASKGKS